MKKQLASCQCYVVHFDNKYDVDTYGSITEIVDYLTKHKLTIESKTNIRIKIVNCINNYEEFELDYGGVKHSYFVSKHEMEIECRLHS